MTGIAARVASLLGADVRAERALAGGDLSQVRRISLADGRSVIAKRGTPARAEARMLRAIRAAGVPAPEVLAAEADLLLLEDLGPEGGLAGAWEEIGEAVARLHAATGPGYGWPEDHAFGPVPIPNSPLDSAPHAWPDFWAERRLGVEGLPADLARRVDRLRGRLPDLLPRAPRASLLHGDLWSGNVMARGGRLIGLIDPACYHGHAEVDLAMLRLFGAPGPGFREGYGPAEAGEAERLPIYQLWPALTHLRLFGAGYGPLVTRLLDAADQA